MIMLLEIYDFHVIGLKKEREREREREERGGGGDILKVISQLVCVVGFPGFFTHAYDDLYLQWATSLAEDSGQLQTDELRRREAFILEIGKILILPMSC